jgi:hypothetical protein
LNVYVMLVRAIAVCCSRDTGAVVLGRYECV